MSNEQISLQLKQNSVQELQFKKSKDSFDNDKGEFSLELAIGFPDDSESTENNNHFAVTFKSEFQIKEGFILKVEYQSIFECDHSINEQFKRSRFPTVNAPAIAFPFFRAFIATFLTNAGFEPIILPSINFMELDRKNKSQGE
ncbi:protein-export chaperone SecB [Glaesserella parasuis]|nr:protein-export chaperone SecB [Glaesserella parasuis]MDP0119571.1 protein-export chaperone SecB [Glaesserella parasuis]